MFGMKYCWVTSALNVVVMMGGTVNATAVVVTVKVVIVDGMDVVIVLLTEGDNACGKVCG